MAECHRAHWRHLANTTELMLSSPHLSPQCKWQTAQFNRFCTARARYFTMGAPFPKIAPSYGGSGPHLTRFHGPMTGSAVFAQMTTECSYTLQWDAPFPPQNCPFPWGI